MRVAGLRRGSVVALPLLLVQGGAAYAGDTYGQDAASNLVVAPEVTNAAAQQSTGLISERIAHAIANATGGRGAVPMPAPPAPAPGGVGRGSGGGSGGGGNGQQSSGSDVVGLDGLAAGNQPMRLAIWGNMSNTWLEGNQTGADFKGTILDSLLGVDYMVTDRILLGFVGGYENARMTSNFNQGALRGSGFALAPYAAYVFNDMFYADATVGFGIIDYTTARQNEQVTGSTTGTRWFASTNLNAALPLPRPWVLIDTLGFLYVSEDQDPYVESDGTKVDGVKVRLGQFRNTVNLGYRFPTDFGFFTPYGSVRLEYDAIKEPVSIIDSAGTVAYGSQFGATFGLGVNVGIGDSTILSLEASTSQFRDNIDMYSLIANVRFRF